jgi:16S rRNA (cytidine1402-2'-O)-methyltransferase
MTKGTLYLLPNLIAEEGLSSIPQVAQETIVAMRYMVVEEIKSVRRLIKKIDRQADIDAIQFATLNEHDESGLTVAMGWLKNGHDVGYMSEAGCAGVADPGQALVAAAHRNHIQVKPLVGPNSILLALMASGFNGQQFRFNGYLPNKQPALSQRIKELEQVAIQNKETQLFIETPYRSKQLLEALCAQCRAETMLCIAADLGSASEEIKTGTIQFWKTATMNLHKRPAVFLLHSY